MKVRRYPVVWTEPAVGDIERLAVHLHSEVPLRADAVLERIICRGEALATMPARGLTPPELRTMVDETWREVQEPPWRLLYRVLATRVEIHAVFDGRRNLRDVLLERILRS